MKRVFEATQDPPTPNAVMELPAEISTGVYSNLVMVSHRKGEFCIDFFTVQPQRSLNFDQAGDPPPRTVTLRSRVFTTPEHFKMIAATLLDNLQLYEKAFGKVEEAPVDQNVH